MISASKEAGTSPAFSLLTRRSHHRPLDLAGELVGRDRPILAAIDQPLLRRRQARVQPLLDEGFEALAGEAQLTGRRAQARRDPASGRGVEAEVAQELTPPCSRSEAAISAALPQEESREHQQERQEEDDTLDDVKHPLCARELIE